MKRLMMITAALVALSAPAFAFDFNANSGVGTVSGGNIAGSQAASGIVGGSAFNGLSVGIVANQSISNAATQSTLLFGPNGMQGTVLNQHNNSTLSSLQSLSLGNALNVGFANGSAGSVGLGTFGGSFGALNIHFNP